MNRGALEPSHNGACFTDLVVAFNLMIANTFFKHCLSHLATWRHEATKRWGLWDGEALYVLDVKAAFEGAVLNRFLALNLEVSDLEDEWQKWVHNISATTLEKVGVRKMRQRHKLGLSPATFKLIIARKAAHLARLGTGASLVSKVAYRVANAVVKKVVARDVNLYLKRQANTASHLRE
ncbi:unnamed protein product [Sphagnum jensenii]|uniref:Reverse transcriptase domain-containing protein n=1 Tax=Sphagnum jensenii TaxID=128206 RepID=A0ABP0W7C7_9BRYO